MSFNRFWIHFNHMEAKKSVSPVCSMEQVTKQYRRRGGELLGPFTLQLYSGEIVGIRGRNGIGKSTLLGMLAGTVQPTSGVCFFAEAVRGRISYVPQELSLYEELTG